VSTRLPKFALALAFAFAALLVAAPAQAAVTCAYDSGLARVTITMGAALDFATVSRAGNTIQVVGTGGLSGQCGTATVKNTNAVYVSAPVAGQQQTVVIALGGGAFAPGKTHESSGVSEIEFHLDLGGSTDQVTIDGGDKAENIRLGSNGANLNGDGDADLLPTGVEKWSVEGSGGADIISAAGGLGTGGKYGRPVSLSGDAGNDVVTGGPGLDVLQGGPGNDRLSGGAGQDTLLGHAGSDRLDGGDGKDSLTGGTGKDLLLGGSGADALYADPGMDGADDLRGGSERDFGYYYQRTGNLRISLDNRANDGLAGEKDNIRSDIETVYSGSGSDRLVGNSGANVFDGGAGNDVFETGAGDDGLSGGFGVASGNDTLRAGAGDDSLTGGDGTDNLDGGPGEDTSTATPGTTRWPPAPVTIGSTRARRSTAPTRCPAGRATTPRITGTA
jgi:Ca2+-binding RTX toxin-like protein